MATVCKLFSVTLLAWTAICSASLLEDNIRKVGLCTEEDSTISMLQGKMGEVSVIDTLSPSPQLAQALPLAWVHMPKCGSSLANLIIHTPGVCNDLKNEAVVTSSYGINKWHEFMLGNFERRWHVLHKCKLSKWGNHEGIGRQYDNKYKGHAIMMMRQPEQRIMSQYYHKQLGWKLPWHPTPSQFAFGLTGCYVKMLTRDSGSALECGQTFSEPTQAEVQEAIRRMKEGFVFIGITEQWDLSVCLFRAKFGGKCLPSDFMNTRHGTKRASTAYDLTSLGGYKDKYDGQVYAEALKIFYEELHQYNLSEFTCKPCFDEAFPA